MSVLEWLAVTQIVLLISAGFFYGISLLVAPKDPGDPLSIFWQTFWKVFLRRRVKFKVALATLQHDKAREYDQMKQHGDVEGIKELLREELDEHEVDDAELARLLEADADSRSAAGWSPADADSGPADLRPRSAVLNVKVIPFAEHDRLAGADRDGAIVNTIHAPEDGRCNKAVIQLLAGALGVKAYQISLLKGHYRARKIVQIAGLEQAQLEAKVAKFS